MSRGLRAAWSYRSTTPVPATHVPAQVKHSDQFVLTGRQMIAGMCLGTAFLYWIDYKGFRSEYKLYSEKRAADKEYERKARMKAYEEERARLLMKADNVPHDAQGR